MALTGTSANVGPDMMSNLTGSQLLARGLDPHGGGQGVSGTGSIGNTPYQIIDPAGGSSFNDMLQRFLSAAGGLKPPNYQDLVTQGVNSPLLQSVLGPALQNLLPGEKLARQNLQDEFRSAGALGSGAMGSASSNLEGALQGQRGNLVSSVISQMLPQITQGLGNQFNQQAQIPQMLLQALGLSKPQVVTGSNQPIGGGSRVSGGSSDGGFSDFLSQYHAQNANNPYAINGPSFPQDPNAGLPNFDLSGLYGGSNLSSGYAPPSQPTNPLAHWGEASNFGQYNSDYF